MREKREYARETKESNTTKERECENGEERKKDIDEKEKGMRELEKGKEGKKER